MDDHGSLRKQIFGQFNLITQIFIASIIASGALLGYIIKVVADKSIIVNSIGVTGTSPSDFVIIPFLMVAPLIIIMPCAYLISTLRKEIFLWAMYIKVFIEKDNEGYETNIYRFREKYNFTESFSPIAVSYFVFVFICDLLFLYVFEQTEMSIWWLMVPVLFLILALVWYYDYRDIPLRCSREYEEKWRIIRGGGKTAVNDKGIEDLHSKIEKLLRHNQKKQALFSVGVADFPVGIALIIFSATSIYAHLVYVGIAITVISIICIIASIFVKS